MKKSASVGLTFAAAFAFTAHAGQTGDPCAATTFNHPACQAAVQRGGYCARDGWVKSKYSQPFPYYYDAYQQHVESGGGWSAAEVGTCGPSRVLGIFPHSRAGFGATGSGRTVHG